MNNGQTVLLKRRRDMPNHPLPACHGGNGSVDWVGVLDEKDLSNRRLRFVHDDILQPGVSVGLHEHIDDEEYYFIVSGRGTMTLNGDSVEVAAGDIAAVFPGGSHAVENTGSEPMRILVFSVNAT
jgi:glyoxylate utilization-related uncharacterized protein